MKIDIPKLAIKQKKHEEALSEEMRILYVALTRAREKLIITALENNIDKKIDNWSKKQTPYIISTAKSFADWICGKVLSTKNDWNIYKWAYKDVLNLDKCIDNDKFNRLVKNIENCFHMTDEYENINKKFLWKYPYQASTTLPAKITVTELKRLGDEPSNEELLEKKLKNIELIEKPLFIENNSLGGAKFGTFLHNTMQRIDFKNPNIEEIIESADEEYKSRLKKYLEQFLKTNLYEHIKNAKNIWREMPFNLSLRLKDIYNVEDLSKDDEILVQGVIDLYFEEDDGLVLVDYKTDNLNSKEEFLNRYKIQLDYYKKALEELTNKKVKKVIIYSFKLNEEIVV